MSDHAADIDRHVRTYLIVFGALLVLTLVTVAAWKFLHLPLIPTVVVALLIATVKASLVACFFMHLISETRLIYGVLILTVVFFLTLLVLPWYTSTLQHIGN